MSKSSPPNPSPLKFDECIAVFAAFTTINGLLYYGALNKQNHQFNLKKLRNLPPSPQPNSASVALPTAKPITTAPESLSLPLTASITTHTPFSSSSLTNISFKQSLSQPEAPEENTSLAFVRDIAVATPTPNAPTTTSVVEFSDVPKNSWASNFIKSLNKRDLITGFSDGNFRPNKYATRAEFATLLQKLFDKKNSKNAIKFKDLTPDYWASDAINKVSTTGLLKGYPAADFRPDQPVTRAEVLVAIATALKLKTPSNPAKTLEVFQDSDQVLKYAISKVAAAKEAGIVAGYPKDKILVPNKPATRAELATMLYQALVISGKEEKVSTRI